MCYPYNNAIMKLKIIFSFVLVASLMASCKRDFNGVGDEKSPNPNAAKMTDLVVPNGFDYATTQDITLDVVLRDRSGAPLSHVRVDVLDAPTDGIAERTIYATGITDANGVVNVPLSVPSYLKQLTIFPYMMGVPNNVEVPITNNKISFHFNKGKIETLLAPPTFANNSIGDGFSRKAGVADKFSKKLGTWDADGKPNFLTTPDVITTSFLNKIMGALPENKAVPTFKPQFLNGNLPVIEVTQTADVWITFVHEGASYKNTLFYYVYNKNTPPATANDIDSLYIVYPNVNFTGSGGALTAGDKVKIGRFGQDTIIGFALAANGFYAPQTLVTKGLNVWYSHREFNAEAAFYKDHAVMLFDDSTDRYLIAFEDVRRDNGQSDQDFNDAVFFASANPPQNIINAGVPPLDPPGDCDGDGVPDYYDDYPCDGTKAYDRYFPSKTVFGTLAYEDLWPSTGDYDMNDLVMRWRFHAVVNAQNQVLELNCKAYIDAKGASLPGGFGVEFPFNASLVSQVTGSQITAARATLSANGTEAGNTKAVMILFDKATNHLHSPGGSFYNTVQTNGISTSDTFNTKMTFTTPLAFANLGTYPFNPFVFTSSRNVEVHLPNKANTALANVSLFGTSRDNSIPSSNRYYKTTSNLPWALHIPGPFAYPSEKKDIVSAHLKFADWVQSGGTTNGDWYENTAGYRNNANIFTR